MIKVYRQNKKNISLISKLIKEGNNIVLPTETVYGIAALIKSRKAPRNIYKIKKRPLSMPLQIIVNSQKEANKIVYFPQDKEIKKIIKEIKSKTKKKCFV